MRPIPLFAAAVVLASAAWADPATEPLTVKGRWLAKQLDMMDVESKWIAACAASRTSSFWVRIPDGDWRLRLT